ncbi:hypothetical protein D3C75_1299880 [compost metagenome]
MAEQGEGWIVRLHEYTGSRRTVTLASDYNISSWQLCDMMERPLEEAVQQAERVQEFKPYEILTFLVQ